MAFCRQRFSSIIYAALLSAAVSLSPAALNAETRGICGSSFHLDALARIDDENYKLSVLGDNRIVPQKGVDRAVLAAYFGGGETPFKAPQLREFVEECTAEGRVEYAAMAMPHLVKMSAGAVDENLSLVEKLASYPAATELFRAVLDYYAPRVPEVSRDEGQVLVALAYYAGLPDPRWVKTRILPLFYRFREAFQEFVSERFYGMVSIGNIADSEQILRFTEEIFGPSDPAVRELRAMLGRVRQVVESGEQEKTEELYPLVELCRQDPAIGRVLYPLLAKKMLEHAARAIDAGQPDAALSILSHTDLSRRTPRLHELAKKALAQLSPHALPVVRDPAIEAMCRLLAENDQAIRAVYTGYLEGLIEFNQQREAPADAQAVFDKLILVRPDPNPLNDQLRVRQAVAYSRKGAQSHAERVLAEVRTGLGVRDKAALWFNGFYVRRSMAYLMVVVLCGAAAVLAGLLVRRFLRASSQPGPRATGRFAGAEGEADENAEIGFLAERKAAELKMNRYRECLKRLGLHDKASRRDIKAAYRKAVKLAHPDSVKAEEQANAQKNFIELTSCYEEALSLREELKLRD